ncbi:hypothetical protein B0H11DRAFT_2303372 [Mycena galericulata]|nr:hypothetical protein B0H11DRAFT_2303372 [Mycena galericulata]
MDALPPTPTGSRSDAQRSSTTDAGCARAPGVVPANNATPAGAVDTIDLVSPAPLAPTEINLVSPTDDERMAVRSPVPPTATLAPLSLLVVQAADILAAANESHATNPAHAETPVPLPTLTTPPPATPDQPVHIHPAQAPDFDMLNPEAPAGPVPPESPSPTPPADDEFPPLPSPGAEVMDESTAAQRRAAKGKARARTPVPTPPPAPSPTLPVGESAFLSPIHVDEQSLVNISAIAPLVDANLGGFFENGARPDPHYTAEITQALAASLPDRAELPTLIVATEEVEIAAAIAASRLPDRDTQGASTSRRPESSSGSPPKRPRLDPIDTSSARVTRASAAAAVRAAAAIAGLTGPAPPAPAIVQPAAPPTGVAPGAPAAPPAGAAHVAPAAGAAPIAPVAPAVPVVPAGPPPVYITADRNPPRAYYTPTDTLPHSTADSDIILDNVDPASTALWAGAANTLLAFVGGGSTDPVAEALAGAELVSNAVNLPPSTVRMGAANSANPRLPSPNAFGITGVPPALGAELIRLGVLCTFSITLFIFALNPPRSGFLGIVEGLTFENTAGGAQEAANAITGALSTNTDFIRLVMTHRDALPANFSTQQVLAAVLGSISVVPLELTSPRGPRVVWRVYMRVTTNSVDGYNAIRGAFRQVVFVTAFNNTGCVREDMSCRICRSIDHPTPLCPFPNAPGWMGPTPTSLPPPPTGVNVRGRGRGNSRGRNLPRGARGGRGGRGF